ncbi:hypothetical protein QTI24_01400 [Variovorax sp. J22P240]|uniref:DUF6988 family protein n=1 Tax=Variovorax sp. J22P240 TaxID=3053514 RepID=UPI0025773E10|nr:hypothetical protein [Variovorax sp. J22P240]MDL9997237.1 hypothetical protein [Variovorax sp. J22P240]
MLIAPAQPGFQYNLEEMLDRSHQLHERVFEILGDDGFHDAPRSEAAVGMCFVALEHSDGLRALMALALPTSAVSLMRHQFEALTRAMWLLYAAPESAVVKLLAPLTLENEQAAKNLPGASDMIEDLRKRVGNPGEGVPSAAHQMLAHFKEVTWPAMNSFVHGGLHPLRRTSDGFPLMLALQIIRNSNGLATMTGMTLAVLTGDQLIASAMSRIQRDFADCLPDLLERTPAA